MPHSNAGSWSIALEQDADAPQVARHALGEWLPDLPSHVTENALITVAELVANAVRFGRPPIHVAATVGTDALVVEVRDEGKDRPHRRVPADDGGIGLNVVYLLADRVEIEADRSCVRCAFSTTVDRSWSTGLPADPDHYSIELVRQGTTLRLVLRGDIDLTARPELDQLLADLDPAHLDRLVVDLREVTFFDSTGLHMAERLHRWGRDHAVAVVFTRGIRPVMLVLQAAGLAHRLAFSDAPEDRLEGFA
jgi:anti-anti-sigma factor